MDDGSVASGDGPVVSVEQLVEMDERVSVAVQPVRELGDEGGERTARQNQEAAQTVAKEEGRGNDRGHEQQAELSNEVGPSEKETRCGDGHDRSPTVRSRVPTFGPDEEAEEPRREGGRSRCVWKEQARAIEKDRVQDRRQGGRGSDNAVVEEHEHASVDGRGEEQSHCNWYRVERGFGRAEGEHRQPDRHDQADAERPEVRLEVRKPDRGLVITGGVERMRPWRRRIWAAAYTSSTAAPTARSRRSCAHARPVEAEGRRFLLRQAGRLLPARASTPGGRRVLLVPVHGQISVWQRVDYAPADKGTHSARCLRKRARAL